MNFINKEMTDFSQGKNRFVNLTIFYELLTYFCFIISKKLIFHKNICKINNIKILLHKVFSDAFYCLLINLEKSEYLKCYI